MPTRGSTANGIDRELFDPIADSATLIERTWLAKGQAIIVRLKPGYAWPVILDEETDLRSAVDRLRMETTTEQLATERRDLWRALDDYGDAPVTRLISRTLPSRYHAWEQVAAASDLPP